MGSFFDIINLGFWGIVFFIIVVKFFNSIRLVPTKTALIVERLGKYNKTLGPGFHALIPFLDEVSYKVDLKEQTIEVPPQECFSRDEVKVQVDGVLYISVTDPAKASYGVTDYRYAAMQLAQTTTRSVIGTLELDRTFEERESISARVVEVLDRAGQTWGIRVHRYEIKDLQPPNSVRVSMEKQVTAERDRRAILAKSEGDKEARINLSVGIKEEMINVSEGEMQKQINEAAGRAEEILTLATATANSIEKIGSSISLEGGSDAVELQLSERMLNKLQGLTDGSTRVIVPANVLNYDGWMKNIGLEKKT